MTTKTRKPSVVLAGGRVVPTGSAAATSTLLTLAPNTAPHSTQSMALVLTGTNFTYDTVVLVDGVAIPTRLETPNRLRTIAFVPGAAGTRQVSVRNPFQVATGTRAFTVT